MLLGLLNSVNMIVWTIHARKVEGSTNNDTQVCLEGGPSNLQVGIKEVMSFKTRVKHKKKLVI